MPDDVKNEISDELWPNEELGDNDTAFIDIKDEKYPVIVAFLKQHNIKECYINYGW